MRTQRIREEKPRPKRRRDRDALATESSPIDFRPAVAHGRELLVRLRTERDAIDEVLSLAAHEPYS